MWMQASVAYSSFLIFLSLSRPPQGTTIDAGTVVVTGTPAGVGYSQHPPRLLADGDVVTVSLAGVGNLTNTIRKEA